VDSLQVYFPHCITPSSLQGLAALLVKGLSGCAAEEIVSVEASSVIEALGLSASLTPSRNNGFLNMFRLMQKKALGFLTEVCHAVHFNGNNWQTAQTLS